METSAPLFKKSSGGITFSAATFAYLVATLIFSLIIVAAGFSEGSDGYIYISYLAAPFGIAAAVAICLKIEKKPFKNIFPVKCKPKYYLIALLLIFGLLFAFGWVNEYVLKFIQLINPAYESKESYLPDLSGGLIVPALLIIAVLPAFFEELLFRGAILNGIENEVGGVRCIFIVGFCFSLFHASPEQTVYQFICGCVFAFVAVRSRSILPSIIMHFINNAVIVVLYAVGAVGDNGFLLISDGANIALTVVSACCFIGGIVWLILDKTPLKKCVKGGVVGFFICAAAGIIVLAILWICNFAGLG